MAFLEAIIATLIVSLISLVGVFTLAVNENVLSRLTKALVALAAGGLMANAFFELIPESLGENVFLYVMLGFVIFFVLERVVKWRHCHEGHCDVHAVTYLSLIGDAIHNFIDGLIIMAAFLLNTATGIATTTAVIMHEIPQELGDFAILIYGGFSKTKALLFNFLSALTAVLGAVVGFFLSQYVQNFSLILLPIAAGGFIYIAASDLIPELHKEEDLGKSIVNFFLFVLGLGAMYIFILFE